MIHIIDGKPFIRPCRVIPDEGGEQNEWAPVSIASRYERLTTLLPLAGAAMMPDALRSAEPKIAAALRIEAPWMHTAIDVIAEEVGMNLWAGRPWIAIAPILLVGPPGAGKSHFARRLGELSGCGDAVLSFAGVNSNAELAGNPRGFKHTQASFPATVMQRVGTANPVLVIDEVEKTSISNIGDPVATLLTLLERSTARRYFDGCIAAEIDLSHVNWIMTANSAVRLPAPLLSRVRVIEVEGPGPEHADLILAILWREVARSAGLPPSALPMLDKNVETKLLRLFCSTRSVRRLRRAVEAVIAVSVRHQPRTVN